jgi:F-type H+-transporting ATPase subunit delta
MSNIAVANQYARALHDIVAQPGAGVDAEGAHTQLKLFAGILKDSRELLMALLSPAVSLEEKVRVIGRVGARVGIGETVQNFLRVVVRHRRLTLLGEVIARYELVLDETAGLVRADVTSARSLDAAQQAAIGGALGRATGRQPRCEYTVDAALVGGVTVRVGSSVFDGSVRGQLEGLRRRLTSAS